MLTRRELLELVGLSTTYLLFHPLVSFSDDSEVFPEEVASGDPSPTGIVLWARIEPKIHERLKKNLKVYIYPDLQGSPDTAIKGKPIKELEIPANYINQAGDYTVKFSVDGLEPEKTYFYVMEYDNKKRLGRFKTLPVGNVDSYKLIFITCQNYEDGYYGAFEHIAEEDAGFVLHLGDAIYEKIYGAKVMGRVIKLPSGNRFASSLEDYRYLYKKYLSDPSYQKARAMQTFIYIWDDHEFANDYYYNYAKDYWVSPSLPEDIRENKELSLNLRKAAIKAWYEYIPSSTVVNFKAHPLEWIRIYRDFKVGNLFHLICTDERSYRESPCPKRYQTKGCPTQDIHTMLGVWQKSWFFSKLSEEGFSWKVWANEVQFVQSTIDGLFGSTDAWDGYSGERWQILEFLKAKNMDNLVILTGDRHAFLAAEVPDRFVGDYKKVLGAEFMTGAISSVNASESERWKRDLPQYKTVDEITSAELSQNPWIKFLNQKTWGYSLLEVRKDYVKCSFYSVDKYKKNPPKELLAEFVYKKSQGLI